MEIFGHRRGREAEKMTSTETAHIVRVLPLSVARPSEILPPGKPFDIEALWFTRSGWLVKGPDAHNPHQVVLPGGNKKTIQDSKGQTREETTEEAGRREVMEETTLSLLHLPELRPIAQDRSYEFTHRRGRRHNIETILVGESPGFIEPKAFDPSDKADSVQLLSPGELEELLTTDEIERGGRPLTLVENLRHQLPHDEAIKARENIGIKGEILRRAFEYEIGVRGRVYERVFRNLKTGQGWINALEVTTMESPSSLEEAKGILDEMDGILRGILHVKLNDATDAEIEERMRIAIEEIYFEDSLGFIQDAGPQKAILVGQVLLDVTRITPHELELLADHESLSNVFHLFDMINETFGDRELSDPEWYAGVCKNLEDYKEAKTSDDPRRREDARAMEEKLWTNLSKVSRLSPHDFAHFANEANEYFDYLQSPLARLVDPEIGQKLFLDAMHVRDTNRLDELVMVMFGVSQYDGDEVSLPLRTQAFNKIITTFQLADFMPRYEEITQQSSFPFRNALMRAIRSQYTEGHLVDKRRDDIMTKASINLGGKEIGISFKFRTKTPHSAFRKLMERGSTEEQNSYDNFGMEIAVDNDDSGSGFVGVVKVLLENLQRENPSGESPVRITHVIDPEKIIENTLRQSNLEQRFDYVPDRHGSGASHAGDWRWVKFVAEIGGRPCEFQIFASEESRKRKKKDDPRYALERQLKPAIEGRVAILELYNRLLGPVYDEIKKATHLKRTLQEEQD